MPFLLAQNAPPGSIQVLGGRNTPLFLPSIYRSANNFALLVSQPTSFDELSQSPLRHSGSGPLWIAVQGYIVEAGSESPSEHVARLLGRHSDPNILADLRGDFTILLVAPADNWHWLHRSATGGRTAFISRSREHTALGSQAHLVAALPTLSRNADPAYISSFLALELTPPVGHSPYEAVRELAVGETVETTTQRTAFGTSTQAVTGTAERRSTEQWVDQFRACFERAVNRTLPPEGEPAVMLSGGLDSGPVAAMAARDLARSGRRITATSWSLPGYPEADERSYIERAGKWLNARTLMLDGDHLLPFSKMDVTAETPAFNAFDPLVRACYAKAAESGCKVILTGGSGDRLYPDPRWLMYDQLLRKELSQLRQTLMTGLRRRGAFRITQYPPLRYLGRRLLLGKTLPRRAPPDWLSPQARMAFKPDTSNELCGERHPIPEYFSRLTGSWLPGLSSLENETAERFGLSRRDPFLDRDLVELMLTMPFSMTFRHGQAKWQMRQAMRRDDALPESIIQKERTGLLGSFFNAGFEAARPRLTEILKQDESWRQWVNPAFVEAALSEQGATSQQKLVTARCVGYCLWRQEVEQLRLKALPGTQS